MTALDPSRVEEYNAFGPWVARVRERADVPPVFAAFRIEFDAALGILKFPRPENRRDLRAGMDLYDYLLVLLPTRLVVLHRQFSGPVERSFALEQLAAASSGANLLDGALELVFTTGETFAIPYNGSSSDLILEFVDALRAQVRAGAVAATTGPAQTVAGVPLPMPMDALGRDDAVFTNAANRLAESEPDARIVSALGRTRLRSTGGWWARLRQALHPATLQGSVVARTPTELVVLSRVGWITRTNTPEISLKRMIVVLRHVTAVDVRADPRHVEVAALVLTAGRAELSILLPSDAPAVETVRSSIR